MSSKREWRRVGAASATVSAGALVFLTIGAGPALADTDTTSCDLLCQIKKGIDNLVNGDKSSSSPSGSSSSSKPKTSTKTAPKSHASTHRSTGSSRHRASAPSHGTAARPAPLPGSGSVKVPDIAPQQRGPALPDIPGQDQDPAVFPQQTSPGRSGSTGLVAATDEPGQMSPLLVATASGIVGAVSALNLSVMAGRMRRNGRR